MLCSEIEEETLRTKADGQNVTEHSQILRKYKGSKWFITNSTPQ